MVRITMLALYTSIILFLYTIVFLYQLWTNIQHLHLADVTLAVIGVKCRMYTDMWAEVSAF